MSDLTRCYPDAAALARERADYAAWVAGLHDWVAPGGQSWHPLTAGTPAVDCSVWRCTRCGARWHWPGRPPVQLASGTCPAVDPARCSICRQPAPGELRDFYGELRCADCTAADRAAQHG